MNPIVKLARQQILRILDGGTVQVPTAVGLLEVSAKADDRWQPLRRLPLPESIVSAHLHHDLEPPSELWSNGEYEVFVNEATETGGKHLSIKRLDRAAIHNWRHLQQIKNEIAGPETEAMELYPAESRLADNANQLHLWCMPPGMPIPVGFPTGFVTITDEDVADFNTRGGRGRQEPMQDGLSVGAAMQGVQESQGLSGAAAKARREVNRP